MLDKMKYAFPALLLAVPLALPAVTVDRDGTGVTMRGESDAVRVTVCGPSLIHVVAGPGGPKAASPEEPWLVERCKPAPFDFTRDDKNATVSTAGLHVVFALKDGRLTFEDRSGNTLAAESDREPRRYDRIEANGETLYRVSERFFVDAHQGLYGLGQHQNGVFNYRGTVVELAQANTDVAVPLLVSSNGSAILIRPRRCSARVQKRA